jgi:hypothetical protein
MTVEVATAVGEAVLVAVAAIVEVAVGADEEIEGPPQPEKARRNMRQESAKSRRRHELK